MLRTTRDSNSFPGISSVILPVFQFPFGIPASCPLSGLHSKNRQVMRQNISEIKVSYTSKVKFSEMTSIKCSKDAETILRNIWNEEIMDLKEEFYILLLSRANQVKGYYKVSEGGVAGTVVDPKIIFSVALKCTACGIILAHNHPSGNLKPSEQDGELTKKLIAGGKLLDIAILDHLILTSDGYYSFADEGVM